MRRANARCAQIGGPDGISHSFQVSTYSGEPETASRACNLLAKRDCRRAERDEVSKDRPEMALVRLAEPLAGRAEGLARTGTGADGAGVRPSGQPKGKRPSTDAGKEMLLDVSMKLMRTDLLDAALVDVAGRNLAGADQLAKPCSRLGVVLVVVVQIINPRNRLYSVDA